MSFPLEAPNGWYLLRAEHQHTDVSTPSDFHEPVITAGGPWFVEFQRYPKGGMATSGRGYSLEAAWAQAFDAAAQKSLEAMVSSSA